MGNIILVGSRFGPPKPPTALLKGFIEPPAALKDGKPDSTLEISNDFGPPLPAAGRPLNLLRLLLYLTPKCDDYSVGDLGKII